VLDRLARTRTPNDDFVGAPSGVGYAYISRHLPTSCATSPHIAAPVLYLTYHAPPVTCHPPRGDSIASRLFHFLPESLDLLAAQALLWPLCAAENSTKQSRYIYPSVWESNKLQEFAKLTNIHLDKTSAALAAAVCGCVTFVAPGCPSAAAVFSRSASHSSNLHRGFLPSSMPCSNLMMTWYRHLMT
jgi:hypothetical protein